MLKNSVFHTSGTMWKLRDKRNVSTAFITLCAQVLIFSKNLSRLTQNFFLGKFICHDRDVNSMLWLDSLMLRPLRPPGLWCRIYYIAVIWCRIYYLHNSIRLKKKSLFLYLLHMLNSWIIDQWIICFILFNCDGK